MLRAVAIATMAATVGCFSPTFPDGALTCGANDACPPGLSCFDGVCARQDPAAAPDASGVTGADAEPNAPDASGPDASADAAPPETLMLAASLAACTSPDNPSTQLCESSTGAGEMAVDLNDSALGIEFHAFLSFAIPIDIAGRTVTSASLVLTATDNAKANGPNSGEVWEVEPFDFPSLSVTAPAKVGNSRLSPDQGSVAQNDTISWPLPAGSIDAGEVLYLGVFALNVEGVNYWNNNGDVAPLLIVDVE